MSHWPFIVGAYALTVAAASGLAVWSWLAMRRAEAEAVGQGRAT